jgi:E3 ubiquitin-protein ligase MARCH5
MNRSVVLRGHIIARHFFFQVLKFLRRSVPYLPLSRHLVPAFAHVPERQAIQATLPPLTDPISVTRTFCGALFFPTIATFLGSSLYPDANSKLRKTLLGGLTFLAVKGVLKIYHKQHIYVRQCQREIMDYNEMPRGTTRTNGVTTTVAQS